MASGIYPLAGSSIVIENLAAQLCKAGVEVTIGALIFKRTPPNSLYNVATIPVGNALKLRRFLEKFDVIHSHHSITNYLALISSTPFVYHYHGAPDFGKGYLFRLSMLSSVKIMNHAFSAVIAVSESGSEELKRYFDLNNVHVIYNGVDTNLFKPMLEERFRKGTPQCLFVGNLYDYKKVDELILALKRLIKKYPKAHMQIVGKGAADAKLKNLASRLNVQDNVSFVGVVPHNNLTPYYASCDVYVTASRCEQFPLPLLEAWACGKPVVASSIRSHEELLSASKAGKIYKVGDVQDLYGTITAVYEHKDEFKCNALQFAKEHDWAIVADQIMRIYADTVSG
jgi:glycosyltransferase involved in cell wall biosynthesis